MASERVDEGRSSSGGWTSWLAGVFSSGLSWLGILYLLGYIIVSGYQARYLNYSPDSIQTRHLTAGVLYAVLTLLQISVVGMFLLQAAVDLGEVEDSKKNGPLRWILARLKSLFDRMPPALRRTGRVLTSFGFSLFIAYYLLVMTLGYLGVFSEGVAGLFPVFKASLLWTALNLLVSSVLVLGMYLQSRQVVRERLSSGGEEPRIVLDEISDNQVTEPEIRKFSRLVLENMGNIFALPAIIVILLLLSATFFQDLYGRIKPEYGGGALRSVKVFLDPASTLPPEVKNSLDGSTRLLLVDKDPGFFYLLSASTLEGRALLAIPHAEVKALRILPDPPIHPSDVKPPPGRASS